MAIGFSSKDFDESDFEWLSKSTVNINKDEIKIENKIENAFKNECKMEIERAIEILEIVIERECEGCYMQAECNKLGTGLCIQAFGIIKNNLKAKD